MIDPVEGRQYAIPALTDKIVVSSAAPIALQQDEPERCRVGSSVIRTVGLLAQHREFAIPDLVEDPARLLITEVIHGIALGVAEQVERAASQLGTHRTNLER